MAAATPRGINEPGPERTWDDLPEEFFANCMRRFRELCVETDDSCREQFLRVLGQVEDWQYKYYFVLSGTISAPDEHGTTLAERTFGASSLGQSVPIQSPPPGAAASSSSPPARSHGVPCVRTADEIIADAERAAVQLLMTVDRVVTEDPLAKRARKAGRYWSSRPKSLQRVEPPP